MRSDRFEQHPEVRKLHRLGENHIKKVVDAYKNFREEKGFSRIASLDEAKQNDFNLSMTLYVMPIVEEEKIDVSKELSELKELEREWQETANRLKTLLSAINQVVGESN